MDLTTRITNIIVAWPQWSRAERRHLDAVINEGQPTTPEELQEEQYQCRNPQGNHMPKLHNMCA